MAEGEQLSDLLAQPAKGRSPDGSLQDQQRKGKLQAHPPNHYPPLDGLPVAGQGVGDSQDSQQSQKPGEALEHGDSCPAGGLLLNYFIDKRPGLGRRRGNVESVFYHLHGFFQASLVVVVEGAEGFAGLDLFAHLALDHDADGMINR